MKWLGRVLIMFILAAIAGSVDARAQERDSVEIEKLKEQIDAITRQLEELQLGAEVVAQADTGMYGLGPGASKVYRVQQGVSVGGYGEVLYERIMAAFLSRLERFGGQLDRWLAEPDQPALIHGDVWTTNVLARDGRIVAFIDPAIYFADPEIELAFTTLFGTFGEPFFKRYAELRPLRPGFLEERRDIYNLYPLLVHVRLFGGSYVHSVDSTLRRFGF